MRPGQVGRAVLAALLSGLQPGLGHLYLRAWLRAGLWAGLWFGSLGLVIATIGIDLSTADAVAAVLGVFAATDGFPLEGILLMLAVTALATVDAYWLAARTSRRAGGPVTVLQCPRCRRELDPMLDFCPWCTIHLDREESA